MLGAYICQQCYLHGETHTQLISTLKLTVAGQDINFVDLISVHIALDKKYTQSHCLCIRGSEISSLGLVVFKIYELFESRNELKQIGNWKQASILNSSVDY